MDWLPIRYREFYDVPRVFIAVYNREQYLFDCSFDDALDDYPDAYRVLKLPELSESVLSGSWEHLADCATDLLGVVPIAAVRFDPTKRKSIDLAIMKTLLSQPVQQIAQRH